MANINYDVASQVVFEQTKGVKTYTYRDIGTKNFKTIYDINQNIKQINTTNTALYDEQVIKNSINNIFTFIPGEEILDPQFGNSLYNYLYTPIVPEMITTIKCEIISLLNKFQPRISISNIKVQTSPDDQLLKFVLYYSINNLSGTYSTEVQF